MLRSRLVPLSVAAALVAACSLTTDLDGFTGGSASPATDAGPDASPDAPAEGSTGGGGRFCSTVPSSVTFCADFDDGLLPGPFDSVLVDNCGTVKLESDSRSSPNAVAFTLPTETKAQAALVTALQKNLRTVIIEFDIRLGAAGGDDFDLIVVDSGTPEVGFQIEAGGTLHWDEDIVENTSIRTPMNVSLGSEWTHLRLDLRVDGAVLNAELSLDGQRRAVHTFEAKVFTNGDAPMLFLGDDSFAGSSNPWRVLVDNFTVDAH